MTLAQLIDVVNEMESAAGKFNADPAKVTVKIYGEHGDPRRAELHNVLRGISISIDMPLR